MIGFDIVGEDNMKALTTAIKPKGTKGPGDEGKIEGDKGLDDKPEVKIGVEATPVWKPGPTMPVVPIDTRSYRLAMFLFAVLSQLVRHV